MHYRFQHVRAVFFEPNSEIRQGLTFALRDRGFKQLVATGNKDRLDKAIRGNEADLIIGDVRFQGHNICGMVKSLRNSQMGNNPFSVAMAITEDALDPNVSLCINAGFDDILVKPLTIAMVLRRIVNLIEARKPFLISNDYIGPDRRDKRRLLPPEAAEIRKLVVPNPVRALAKDGVTIAELQRQIGRAKQEINQQRIECCDSQIGWIVGRLVPRFLSERIDADCLTMMMRLEVICRDLGKCLAISKWRHIGDLCDNLCEVVERINQDPEHPSTQDVDSLPNLASAIHAAFTSDTTTMNAAMN